MQSIERATTLGPNDLGIVPEPLPMNQRQHIGKALLGDGGRGGVNGRWEGLCHAVIIRQEPRSFYGKSRIAFATVK